MPVRRPDGVELQWEERGQGPLVVLASQFFGYPAVFEDLIADLATDHRIVTYDARGTGASTRQGPYDIATDAADLGAVIEELADAAVVVGMGDAVNRGVRLGAERPDLVAAVLTPGGNPVGRAAAVGTDALVNSPSVLEALAGLIGTDYRAALRTIISSANPQMEEEDARERVSRVVAYCPQEAGVPRLHAWIEDDIVEESRALGDRLWILWLEGDNPWFAGEQGLLRTRELLPDARVEKVANGPLSRPDLTAAVVRAITGVAPSIDAAAGRGRSA